MAKKAEKTSKGKKSAKSAKGKKTEQVDLLQELRVTELEQVHFKLTDRDYELAQVQEQLIRAKLENLRNSYQQQKFQLEQGLKSAIHKVQQTAHIRNQVVKDAELRLREIDPNFSFKDYLIQDDGRLIPEEDLIPPPDDGESTGLEGVQST